MNKEKKEESTTDDAGEGDKYETTPLIERARIEREGIEKATKELKEENDRREMIMAKQALGGVTEAGGVKEKPKEETNREYRVRINKEMAEGKTEFGN